MYNATKNVIVTCTSRATNQKYNASMMSSSLSHCITFLKFIVICSVAKHDFRGSCCILISQNLPKSCQFMGKFTVSVTSWISTGPNHSAWQLLSRHPSQEIGELYHKSHAAVVNSLHPLPKDIQAQDISVRQQFEKRRKILEGLLKQTIECFGQKQLPLQLHKSLSQLKSSSSISSPGKVIPGWAVGGAAMHAREYGLEYMTGD